MVTVYTRQGCAPCAQLKRFFNLKNIDFTEIKFEENPELYPPQFRIFPLVKIGEEFVQGLNLGRIMTLIK